MGHRCWRAPCSGGSSCGTDRPVDRHVTRGTRDDLGSRVEDRPRTCDDESVPQEETLAAFDKMIKAGKVRGRQVLVNN